MVVNVSEIKQMNGKTMELQSVSFWNDVESIQNKELFTPVKFSFHIFTRLLIL